MSIKNTKKKRTPLGEFGIPPLDGSSDLRKPDLKGDSSLHIHSRGQGQRFTAASHAYSSCVVVQNVVDSSVFIPKQAEPAFNRSQQRPHPPASGQLNI